MTQSNQEPPSFFIVLSEKRDYRSSVQLGNAIFNIQQPRLVLFRPHEAHPSPIPVGGIANPKALQNYVIDKDNSSNTKVGLFAKILECFGAGGELSHQSEKDVSERYTINSITFELLDPSRVFYEALKDQKPIIDHLKDGRVLHEFLVTGMVTAAGVVFESTTVNDKANEASLGKHKLKVDWEDHGPTVLAYKLQKLRLRDDELIAEDVDEVPYSDGDDEENIKMEVEYSDKLDRNDVAGLKCEAGKDELEGGGFNLYALDE